MVSIRKAKQGFARRQRGGGNAFDRFVSGVINGTDPMARVIAAGVGFMSLFAIYWISTVPATDGAGAGILRRQSRRKRPVKDHLVLKNTSGRRMGDRFDSMAQDVINKLDCVNLFNQTMSSSGFNDENQRRLSEDGDENPEENEFGPTDDFNPGDYNYVQVNAQHLMCVAAMPDAPPKPIADSLKCDAAGEKRQTLLELWSSAESQMGLDMIKKVLELARENESQTLLDKTYNLWAPELDNGYSFMLKSINNNDSDNQKPINEGDAPEGTNKAERGGLADLHENLGPGKIFVDVGSCLGLTTLAISQKYPGTKIVSIEPAQPNWLLQQINLRCNMQHDELSKVHIVLSGVGHNSEDEDNLSDRFLWRPTATTSTRSWTPKDERGESDLEIFVRLRRLESLLAEAGVYDTKRIDVLNLDCEGCEYNLVPALSQAEFDSISTILGGAHWGYIPTSKLPSSERGRKTHERICVHEHVAKNTKECCAVPDLEVKSQTPGEVLKRSNANSGEDEAIPHHVTVADLAGDLCIDFDDWADEHMLNGISEDFNWFELTGEAQ